MHLLPPNLSLLSSIALRSRNRRGLDSVRLVLSETGYEAAATDGKALAVISGGDAKELFSSFPAFDSFGDGKTEGLIHRETWTKAFREAGKRSVAVKIDEKGITLASTNADRSSLVFVQLEEGRYPKIDTVWPKTPPVVSIKFDVRWLISLLKVAAAVAESSNSEIKLECRTPDAPIAILAENASGQTFKGLLMPKV